MSTATLSGSDTIKIGTGAGRVLSNLADGNCVELTFPNNIANVKTGKNGNAIFGYNASGHQCEAKIRVMRGSDDDKYLNNLYIQQQQNFAGTTLLDGEFIKKLGDGKGNVASDIYVTSGGVFKKGIEAKSNVEGETDQSVAVYEIMFSKVQRAIT